MKKTWFVFGTLLLIPSVLFAAGIPASGIDLAESEIEIHYTPAPNSGLTVSDWECLGMNGDTRTTNLQTFGITESDGVFEANLSGNHCFRQAGSYSVSITPVDNAGNEGATLNQTFIITAGDPDEAVSTLTQGTNCDDAVASGQTAPTGENNQCTLTLSMYDQFGNPVTQLNGSGGSIQATDLSIANDPAVGTSFVDGLYANGYLNTGSSFSFSDEEGVFVVTAAVPSLKKATADSIPETAARDIDFVLSGISDIELNGDRSTTDSVVFVKTVPLRFTIPMSQWAEANTTLIPGTAGPPVVADSTDIDVTLTLKNTGLGVTSLPTLYSSVSGNLIDEIAELSSCTLTPATYGDFENMQSCTENNGSEFTGTIGFKTNLEYLVDSLPVGYETCRIPAPDATNPILAYDCPSLTCTNISGDACEEVAANIGVDIEGSVQGDPTKNFFMTTTDNEILNIGAVTATDIREGVTQNAFKMIRGLDATTESDFNLVNSFANTDVVLIENGTVNLSGTLPSGQNTLIVHNQNVVISGNLTYDGPNADSFGVIVINDAAGAEPTTGNIFVRPGVSQIFGSFYADGAIMTNDTNNLSTWTNDPATLKNQLVLTGALMTRNTIGGADNATTMRTPWGETSTDTTAKKYDLNYVRRFPQGDGTGVTDETNPSSFVIRLDGKASSQLAPPGFRLSEEIRR